MGVSIDMQVNNDLFPHRYNRISLVRVRILREPLRYSIATGLDGETDVVLRPSAVSRLFISGPAQRPHSATTGFIFSGPPRIEIRGLSRNPVMQRSFIVRIVKSIALIYEHVKYKNK